MIQLGLFIAISVGFLVLLFLVMRRPAETVVGSAGGMVAARRSVQELQTGLLPNDLIERIFGNADLEYVSATGSPRALELFMGERKRLAQAWVRQVRDEVLRLKEFHTRQSRMFADASLATEISIAFNFAELQVQCRVLQLLLQWRGPYAAPYLVRKTATRAAGLCAVFDRSLAFLTPALSDGTTDDSEADRAAI